MQHLGSGWMKNLEAKMSFSQFNIGTKLQAENMKLVVLSLEEKYETSWSHNYLFNLIFEISKTGGIFYAQTLLLSAQALYLLTHAAEISHLQ
jgi:hypothetical protein